MSHVFDPEKLKVLEDAGRLEELPVEELTGHLVPGDVLDLGCGPGLYTSAVAEVMGGRVIGADLQPEMLDRFRKRGVPQNVELVRCIGRALPYSDGALTSVVSVHVLHEFAGDGTLEEVYRVLGDGGVLVLVDWRKQEMERGPPLEHRISVEEAREMTSSAGFSVVEERPLGPFYLLVCVNA
ncbi:MAG: Ubiquinone/menaquinone biosynthesis C-methyltransferase UbiE [Methanonatronarchaeales archaeon]|nr:Ubiquinone/menaquinone biosynthesis C-methyltransferase UbiE [Methanonatronarchaeales archaeon]